MLIKLSPRLSLELINDVKSEGQKNKERTVSQWKKICNKVSCKGHFPAIDPNYVIAPVEWKPWANWKPWKWIFTLISLSATNVWDSTTRISQNLKNMMYFNAINNVFPLTRHPNMKDIKIISYIRKVSERYSKKYTYGFWQERLIFFLLVTCKVIKAHVQALIMTLQGSINIE